MPGQRSSSSAASNAPQGLRAFGTTLSGSFFDVIADLNGCIGRCRGHEQSESPSAVPSKSLKVSAAEFLGCEPKTVAFQSVALAHTSQLVYATSSAVITLALPYISKSFGGDVQTFADLMAAAGGLQIIGSIAFGSFADRYGPRGSLLLAHSSALASYGMVATAHSRGQLFLSTVPLLTTHGFQAAQQVAVVHSTPKTRAIALGRIGMSYGVGFLTGTTVFSSLAKSYSPQTMAFLSLGLEAGLLSSIILLYPENDDAEAKLNEEPFSLTSMQSVLQRPGVASLLLFKTVTVTSAGMVLNMVPQFAMDPFGLTASQTGLLMSYLGVVHLVAQGIIVPMIGTPTEDTIQMGTVCSLGTSLLGLAATGTTTKAYIFWLGPITAACHSAHVAVSSKLTCLVPKEEVGTVLGLSMASMSFATVVSPLAAAQVFKTLGFWTVPLVGAATITTVTAALMDENTKITLWDKSQDSSLQERSDEKDEAVDRNPDKIPSQDTDGMEDAGIFTAMD